MNLSSKSIHRSTFLSVQNRMPAQQKLWYSKNFPVSIVQKLQKKKGKKKLKEQKQEKAR